MAIMVTLALLDSPAFADADQVLSMSFEELLQVKVSVASNIESESIRQPVSLTQISKQQIKMSGARTLNDLLTWTVPGYFKVEDQDDTIAAFRGLVPDNNSKVLLLLDGVPLNADWFWGPPDAILNGMDLNFIERIEVIRGPGSVTLGQGALIGVINIVTRSEETLDGSQLSVQLGEYQLKQTHFIEQSKRDNWLTRIYLGSGRYDGQLLRNEGWANLRSEQGLTVFERQHRLNRNEYQHGLVQLENKHWFLQAFQFDSTRDLYNFFRDREVVQQRLQGVQVKHKWQLNEQWQANWSAFYMNDDYALKSHGENNPVLSRFSFESIDSGFSDVANAIPGYADDLITPNVTMGGVREIRDGLKGILNYQSEDKATRIAFGVELNRFRLGRRNHWGNNFIINEQIQHLGIVSDGLGGHIAGQNLNEVNTWVKPNEHVLKSGFAELYYQSGPNIDWFAAFRFDDHEDWGSQISPRLGMIYLLDAHRHFRVSWQRGFRGAVGVQFSGGFVQDGLMSQNNFAALNAIATSEADFDYDGIAANDNRQLSLLKPEVLDSLELAYTQRGGNYLWQNTLFFNTTKNIIAAEANGYETLQYGDQVGTDSVGTWNGNWYFQNQTGQLKQWGLEVDAIWKLDTWQFSGSYSLVKAISATDNLAGIYSTASDHPIAFPEQMIKFQVVRNFETDFGASKLHFNGLYFHDFYSPTDVKLSGSATFNVGLVQQLHWLNGLQWRVMINNLFDNDALYPINGTGNVEGSEGTPSIEGRTTSIELSYTF